jgi:hypothetical protein
MLSKGRFSGARGLDGADRVDATQIPSELAYSLPPPASGRVELRCGQETEFYIIKPSRA